jgi:hypothetical protein
MLYFDRFGQSCSRNPAWTARIFSLTLWPNLLKYKAVFGESNREGNDVHDFTARNGSDHCDLGIAARHSVCG